MEFEDVRLFDAAPQNKKALAGIKMQEPLLCMSGANYGAL